MSVPVVAGMSMYTAPVHLNVGGTLYTSSMETLTKFPNSKLAKYFNGSLPVVVDTMKQQYFFDRDGKTFRHILNYLRNSELILPDNYSDLNLLLKEATHFEIEDLCSYIKQLIDRKNKECKETKDTSEDTEDSSSEEEDSSSEVDQTITQSNKKNKKKNNKKKRSLKEIDRNVQKTAEKTNEKCKINEDCLPKFLRAVNFRGESQEKCGEGIGEKQSCIKNYEDKKTRVDNLAINESPGEKHIVCVTYYSRDSKISTISCSDEKLSSSGYIFEHFYRQKQFSYANHSLKPTFLELSKYLFSNGYKLVSTASIYQSNEYLYVCFVK